MSKESWYKEHPDKNKEYCKRYRASHLEESREKAALWRKNNPEKVKENNARYRKSNKEKIKDVNAAYRKENFGKLKIKRSELHADNKDKANAVSAAWRAANKKKIAEYRKNNAEKAKSYDVTYRILHPDKRKINEHNRRVKKNNNGGKLSAGIVSKLLSVQRGKCAVCKKTLIKIGHHIDHIIPLVRGGKNIDANVQLTCPSCNIKKGGKDPIQFMREMGCLL